jgi:uncharacterized ion transporter superfamily protein YfcC
MRRQTWSIDSLTLIFSMIVIAQILVYVIPQGQFERQPYPENPGRSMVVADSYQPSSGGQRVAIMPWHFLVAIPQGLAVAQDIIFLISHPAGRCGSG